MRFLVYAAALVAISACGQTDRSNQAADAADTAARTSGSSAAGDAVRLTLPPGFTATVFAENLGGARHAVAVPNGTVYVNTWLSPYDTTRRVPPGGYVVALRDTNSDGKADLIRRFGSTRASGSRGGTGIAIHDRELFVEADSQIVMYQLPETGLIPTEPTIPIITGLPTTGGHPMHPIAVDARNIYVNMGSDTNACQEKDREAGSPGRRPCRELLQRAGIWRFDRMYSGPEEAAQRFTQSRRFATGIRNAVGLAIDPADGTLYATQHGRDQLAQNWPKLYNWKQSAELPSEELIRVERGGDYGWPYCYHDPTLNKLVLAPEYGGDGKKVGECAEKRGPVAAFPAHWAPNALVFYTGTTFPEQYRGGTFIAFHGSWNRSPEPQAGYNVVFQPMANGKPTGPYQVFADGFAGRQKEPGMATHRPAGLAVGPDGSLYITDDQAGTIWRVTYNR
ncbi:MAG TPA: PQQ-dependent sugar dehydrogenase [Gemmatimonadales bacterium]|nr:PQQ-dependent sugar dehydrogenase [Gemmatimonadales bacterium]